jgi:hypothetical protein
VSTRRQLRIRKNRLRLLREDGLSDGRRHNRKALHANVKWTIPFEVIAEIRRKGSTGLLVEQNALMALSAADRGYVLETGRLVVEGRPDALWKNDEVRAAYLGGRTIASV